MTIVVSVKVTDGIVIASDSATTFFDANGAAVKVYNNANKIFNLVKGLPLGATTCGSGSIGHASIATLSKDLRKHFSNPDSPYYFDQENYTVEDVAMRCQKFYQDQLAAAYPQGFPAFRMGYRVSGYGTHDALAQSWSFDVVSDQPAPPFQQYQTDSFGPRWDGDGEALDRLILGASYSTMDALVASGLDPTNKENVYRLILEKTQRQLFLPAMPIQDAIDLARYLAETAAKFSHFNLFAATIGGPIEVATITKHEGFKWISRKHYFAANLNHGASHV